MRLIFSLLSLALCIPLSSAAPSPRPTFGKGATLRVFPLRLMEKDPTHIEVGELTYIGGIELKGRDPAFGGFSAMNVRNGQFTLVSDGGTILRFDLGADFAVRNAEFSDVGSGPATGWEKRDRDVEAMTQDPETGRIWLAFERYNAIWRFDASLTHSDGAVEPEAMSDWALNGGPESMVRLRDGSFIVISETSRPKGVKGAREGIYFRRDPIEQPQEAFRFAYDPPEGYDPVDIAEMPDGRLMILNRRFTVKSLFTSKVEIVDRAYIRAGARVRGRTIASLAKPLLHDNFEALALTEEAGDLIIWLASDDNQQFWQRTMLLKFRLNRASGDTGPAN